VGFIERAWYKHKSNIGVQAQKQYCYRKGVVQAQEQYWGKLELVWCRGCPGMTAAAWIGFSRFVLSVLSFLEPSTLNPQPSTLNPLPLTVNPDSGGINRLYLAGFV
jgi:hypothetical protein